MPETESQGRIHTSACTVAVMPEADELEDVQINSNDIRIDTFRSLALLTSDSGSNPFSNVAMKFYEATETIWPWRTNLCTQTEAPMLSPDRTRWIQRRPHRGQPGQSDTVKAKRVLPEAASAAVNIPRLNTPLISVPAAAEPALTNKPSCTRDSQIRFGPSSWSGTAADLRRWIGENPC